MEKKVSILGCGWLGFPLAKQLIEKGWQVKGSTTSKDKLKVLKGESINPFQIKLDEDNVEGDLYQFLEGSKLLIINIPPGLRSQPDADFILKLKPLLKAISESGIEKVLYISSTGVFQDHPSLPSFTEHYQFTKKEIDNSQLIQAEHLISDLSNIETTILRLGGLIGKERHPVQYLSGKENVKNPNSPVNLIHLENCILVISEIIQQNKFGSIFHGVEDVKISKEDYYQQKAKEFNIPIPEFDHSEVSAGKNISMEWTKRELGIDLKTKV